MELDKWQKEVLEHSGNVSLRSGRQVGKSTVVGLKAANFALQHPNTNTLIIAAAQRQSRLLFEKVKSEVDIQHHQMVAGAGGYKNDPKLSTRRNSELRREYEIKHGIYKEFPTIQIRITSYSQSFFNSIPSKKQTAAGSGFE